MSSIHSMEAQPREVSHGCQPPKESLGPLGALLGLASHTNSPLLWIWRPLWSGGVCFGTSPPKEIYIYIYMYLEHHSL